MNIAIFTDAYSPQINGVVTSVLSFRRELEKAGHKVYIFAPSFAGREKKEEGVYRFYSIPYQTEMMREQRIALPFSRGVFAFPRLGIDIVHFQVTHYVGAYGLLLAMIHKIPAVHTFHTLFVKYTHYVRFQRALAVRFVKWISRVFGNRCVRIISPSPEMRDEIVSYGVRPPVEVIPTGIDYDPDRKVKDPDGLYSRYSLPRGKKLLIFVGRFAKEKNIELLFDVLLDLNAGEKLYHLLLVGDGPGRPELEDRVDAAGIRESVTITGYIPREEVFDLLQLADLMVFPSETETQGLVVLEAMSVGTPVVAANRMGAGDVLKDGRGGIAVPADRASFTGAVRKLMSDPALYAEKCRTAREKAADWSAAAMTEKLVAFYETAIREYREKRFGKRGGA